MKKPVLFSIGIATLALIALYNLDFFYVSVAAHNSYRLNKTEANLIASAIERFRDRLENQKFDELREDLSKGRRDEYWEKIIFKEIFKDFSEYGKARSWEFVSCAQPQFDEDLNETVYHLDYLTKFDNGEGYESFIFVKKSDNDVNLINAEIGLAEVTERLIEERDKQKAIVERYPSEIIIPYADRYIEIRY